MELVPLGTEYRQDTQFALYDNWGLYLTRAWAPTAASAIDAWNRRHPSRPTAVSARETTEPELLFETIHLGALRMDATCSRS